MAHLVYKDREGNPVAHRLGDREHTVGRTSDCDLVVTRASVSRRHAKLVPRHGSWVVVDLGSTHGTWVNRERVDRERVLLPGDRIEIGEFLLVYEAGDPHEGVPVATTLDTGSEEPTGRSHVRSQEVLAEKTLGAIADPSPADLSALEQKLRACGDVESICRECVEAAMKQTGASRGVLAMLHFGDFVPLIQVDESGAKNFPAAPIRISRSFVDRMVAHRVGMIAREADDQDTLEKTASVTAAGIRSMVCAPLLQGTEVRGYLYLDARGAKTLFERSHLDLVCAIARCASAAVVRLENTGS